MSANKISKELKKFIKKNKTQLDNDELEELQSVGVLLASLDNEGF